MTKFILWGLAASPFQLKMQALLDYSGYRWERWPQQAGRLAAISMATRLDAAKRSGSVRRFPAMAPGFDEYPAVPFYTLNGREFYYDSSALAQQLDLLPQGDAPPLIPRDPRLAFICQLVDEAFDEFGLYMVHHMRWVGSARTTPMGDMTANELRPLLPLGFAPLVAWHLYRRQVSRCPYLFSVAPQGFQAGVSRSRTPPSRAGFPPTHALLEAAWHAYLGAMEQVLSQQPYLLGERFTLADASAYGQLGMNLVDPEARDLLARLAPCTYRWLYAIARGEHRGGTGELSLAPPLRPLLSIIGQTFVPLMTQNENAYAAALAEGETVFNEAAFKRDRALYDGVLLGHPFRAVVKTFQVRVWREIKHSFQALEPSAQQMLRGELSPDTEAALNTPDVVSKQASA